MTKLVYGLLLSALPLSAAFSTPAPAVGPGGVAVAVAAFAAAVDAGDADALAGLVVAGDPGIVLRVGADGGIEQPEGAVIERFLDVGASGVPVSFGEERAFVAGMLGDVRSAKDGASLLRTEVKTILANCASERCSFAVVDLVREYGVEGEVTRRVPLRATALLRYTPEGFRIFHWHASPLAPAPKQRAAR